MKNKIQKLLYMQRRVLLLALTLPLIFRQIPDAVAQTFDEKNKGELICNVSQDEMNALRQKVKATIQRLRTEGKLDFKKYRSPKEEGDGISDVRNNPVVTFRWPLTTAEYRDFASWHIGNFVDLDPDSDGDDDPFEDFEIEDYHCGNRTYDGHGGIDIGIDPYTWLLKDNGSIQVVAAAAGIVVHKHDGEFDENCDWDNIIGSANMLVLLHEDGTTASFYMHLKNGSLTSKEEGDFIEAGEYIATVGSSGFSTGPHLHFQVDTGYEDLGVDADDESGMRIDPFALGSCSTSSASSWISELPYDDPAVLTLETHSSNPDTYPANCNQTISLFQDNSFSGTTTIWTRSKFRDWVDGSGVVHSIIRPSGSVKTSYTQYNPGNDRDYFPGDASTNFNASDAAGTYRYTVSFGGKTYSHYFAYNCVSNYGLTGSVTGHKGYMCSNSIASNQDVSGLSSTYVKYMADNYVVLDVGFWSHEGGRFVANLKGCNNSTLKTFEAEEAHSEPMINSNPGLVVFPNPGSGVFNVNYTGKEIIHGQWLIRNSMGQVIVRSPIENNGDIISEVLDLSSFPKGIYVIELNHDDGIEVQRVILQ